MSRDIHTNFSEQPPAETRETKKGEDLLELILDASDANEATKQAFDTLIADLPALPTDVFEAAKAIRKFLLNKDFEYDTRIFDLPGMLRRKKGNCLGLSLLFGTILQRCGFRVEYQLIYNPKDAIYNAGKEVFEEFRQGDYFDFDHPFLPKEQVANPPYRFAPVGHPSLVLDGKIFETTALEFGDSDEDVGYSPEAEFKQSADFAEVASHILLDRARHLTMQVKKPDYQQALQLTLRATKMSPRNREAWALLWNLAEEVDNSQLEEEAKKKYLEIGGKDSRYNFTAYGMTERPEFLDRALEQDQTNILAYFIKHVVNETDQKEKRFNLAVVAHCIARSGELSLSSFYADNQHLIEELYGPNVYHSLAV